MANTVTALFDGYFGWCLACMRQALFAAIVAWAAFFGARWAGAFDAFQLAISIGATGLSLLWLAHVGAYAWRRAIVAPRRAASARLSDDDRGALWRLTREAGVAMRASVGGALAEIDETELAAAYQRAIQTLEDLKRNGKV